MPTCTLLPTFIEESRLTSIPTSLLTPGERLATIHRIAELEHAITSTTTPGRPLAISRPSIPNPSLTNAQFITHHIREGKQLTTLARIVGISAGTLRKNINDGKRIATLLDDGDLSISQLQGNDLALYKFYIDYSHAEGEHRADLESERVRVALKGKETTTHKDLIIQDEHGNVKEVVSYIDSRRVTRDGTMAGELLSTIDPAIYSPPKQLKLTGSGADGEIKVSTTNSASDLMQLLPHATLDEKRVLLDLIKTLDQRRRDNETGRDELEKRSRQQVIESTAVMSTTPTTKEN